MRYLYESIANTLQNWQAGYHAPAPKSGSRELIVTNQPTSVEKHENLCVQRRKYDSGRVWSFRENAGGRTDSRANYDNGPAVTFTLPSPSPRRKRVQSIARRNNQILTAVQFVGYRAIRDGYGEVSMPQNASGSRVERYDVRRRVPCKY